LESQTTRDKLEISDTLQQTFQEVIARQFVADPGSVDYGFFRDLVAPSLNATPPIDLALDRKHGQFSLQTTPDSPVDLQATYFEINRSGTRAAGTSFGLENAVETAEPIDNKTIDLSATIEVPFRSGLLHGSFRYDDFADVVISYRFDNPFRVSDSSGPDAILAPGPDSIDGPPTGRISLAPDNQALTAGAGVVLKLPLRSRLTADVTAGRWTQDVPFIAYTTNSAIGAPFDATDLSKLPAPSLGGRIDTQSLAVVFTSRPVKGRSITSRFRDYDLSNATDRITFPGYASFDSEWVPVARISVPYGWRRNRWDNEISYDAGPVTLETGFRSESLRRDFRDVKSSTENTWRIGADLRTGGWIALRTGFERGSRSAGSDLQNTGEGASFVGPVPLAFRNPDGVQPFDLAERDLTRWNALLQLTPPSGDLDVTLGYTGAREDYPQTRFGLSRSSSSALSLDADWAPGERWNVWGFVSRDSIDATQNGVESALGSAAAPSAEWIARENDDVLSFGGGLTATILPERLDVNVSQLFERTDSAMLLDSAEETIPAADIPRFDDSKLARLTVDLTLHATEVWDVVFGGWIERYDASPVWNEYVRQNYFPGMFLIDANQGDYTGHVEYVRARYHW
ncbi:MAG: MtrB/PioB family outer membrane beta-barrel protein, partial [Thermoanaerobaculia bacterium]